MTSFTKTFTPTPADIDELGHVNNAVWVRWIQDVAVGHWIDVASPDHADAFDAVDQVDPVFERALLAFIEDAGGHRRADALDGLEGGLVGLVGVDRNGNPRHDEGAATEN